MNREEGLVLGLLCYLEGLSSRHLCTSMRTSTMAAIAEKHPGSTLEPLQVKLLALVLYRWCLLAIQLLMATASSCSCCISRHHRIDELIM